MTLRAPPSSKLMMKTVSLGSHAEDMYFDYDQYFVDQGAPEVFGNIAEDIDMEYILSFISHLTDTDE